MSRLLLSPAYGLDLGLFDDECHILVGFGADRLDILQPEPDGVFAILLHSATKACVVVVVRGSMGECVQRELREFPALAPALKERLVTALHKLGSIDSAASVAR